VWADYESTYLRDYKWDVSHGEEIDNGRYRSYNGPMLPKAWNIFNDERFHANCNECELRLLEGNAKSDDASDDASAWESDEGSDESSDEEPDEETCECDVFKHFVSEHWLCIPCPLVEEQKAYDSVLVRQVLQTRIPLRRFYRHLCACGAPAKDGGIPLCKYCGMYKTPR
jgi:hypothetical protein